jgi:hypothetical protein
MEAVGGNANSVSPPEDVGQEKDGTLKNLMKRKLMFHEM